MNRDPLLRTILIRYGGYKNRCKMRVVGGLQKIGEQTPYFTLTAEISTDGHEIAGGCMHEEILKHFKFLADLAALHLSDENGVPMHAEANGWYWLSGALGGMGEQYHGGNAEIQHWKADGAFNGYRKSTPEECLEIFAKHCRIDLDFAREIAAVVKADTFHEPRLRWQAYMDNMRPRWKQEADACILKHGLRVFE